MCKRLLIGCVFVGIAGVCPAQESWAQDVKNFKDLSESEKDTFEIFLKQGRVAFEDGRFDMALSSFEQAYYVFPQPKLLYLIAQCHNQLGHATQAIEYYRKFLEEVPDTSKREEIEETITRLDALKETRVVIKTKPEGAKVLIDDQFHGVSPQSIVVAKNSITLTVELDGYSSVTQKLELESGVEKEVFLLLTQDTQDAASSGGLHSLQKVGIGVGAAGGGAVIAGSVLSIVGWMARKDLDAIDKSANTRGDFNTRYISANRKIGVGLGVLGGGVLMMGAGSVLFTKGKKAKASDESARIVPTLRLGGEHSEVGVMLQF